MPLPDERSGQVLPIAPPFPEIKTWHLVYHLAPLKKRRIRLHYHLEQLRRYYRLFNGRKILSCMTGSAFLPMSYIKPNLPDPNTWEIVEAPNSPLHEGTSMVAILEDLLHDSPDHAFMYAHGKGVSRAPGENHKWIEYLYKYTFGSFDRLKELLTQYPIAGPFLWRAWSDPETPTDEGWLYPGTFFAVRFDVLSRMPWRERPVEDRYWMEQLPGHVFQKKYLGNVSNAIFGDTARVEAAETNASAPPSNLREPEDAFWARFDAALHGQPYFAVETKIS